MCTSSVQEPVKRHCHEAKTSLARARVAVLELRWCDSYLGMSVCFSLLGLQGYDGCVVVRPVHVKRCVDEGHADGHRARRART